MNKKVGEGNGISVRPLRKQETSFRKKRGCSGTKKIRELGGACRNSLLGGLTGCRAGLYAVGGRLGSPFKGAKAAQQHDWEEENRVGERRIPGGAGKKE